MALLGSWQATALVVTTRSFTIVVDMIHLLFEAVQSIGSRVCQVYIVLVIEVLIVGLQVLAQELVAPLLLNLTIGNLMQTVDDGLDESESQIGVTHVPLNALLEHKVAKLSVHDLVQVAAVDELLDNLLLKLIVGHLDGQLDQV